jgi:hypothetical protein
MNNIFIPNPIKLNIYNISGQIYKKLIFLGNIPTAISSEVSKIHTGKFNNNILSTFYGKRFKELLEIGTSGGNEFSFDDEQPTEYIDLDEKAVIHKQTKKANANYIEYVYGDDISIYPDDDIITFKKKISIILNMPIYRQHIWINYNEKCIPLLYSILVNTQLLDVNILDPINQTTNKIENIYVNNYIYQNKSLLKIKANDTFSILYELYHKYGTSEFNLIDLDEFIAPNKDNFVKLTNDKLNRELLYYGFIIIYWPMLSYDAFYEYIHNTKTFGVKYPKLDPNKTDMISIFKNEKYLIDIKYDVINNKSFQTINNDLKISIIYASLNMLTFGDTNSNRLSLRNIFDMIALDDMNIACVYSTTQNNNDTLIHKIYKDNKKIHGNIEKESIVFKLVFKADNNEYINFILYGNGNYIVKVHFNEESKYSFDDIYDICTKVTDNLVDKINMVSSTMSVSHKTIPKVSKKNSNISDINCVIKYNKTCNSYQYKIIKNIIQKFTESEIMSTKNLESMDVQEYFFIKGMYIFDINRIDKYMILDNYYAYLTDGEIGQKWGTIFEKTRITKFFHRVSDIKIEIIGIKYDEFFNFLSYIITIFHLYKHSNVDTLNKYQQSEEKLKRKKLKNLKEQDPVLYNFKDNDTNNLYSKICQKPYQPIILDDALFNILTKDKKKNVIKYWNFTKQEDAYYTCPNPKFPHIKFIVNRHPKDFCIPCCKKSHIVDNTKDLKKIIFNTCIKDHIYKETEKTMTLGSRYISSYGKFLEPGRLSRLPEETLEPMFYETFSMNVNGIDEECLQNTGYYIYGTEQLYNGINISILNIMSISLEMPTREIILKIIKLIEDNSSKFYTLLNGEIIKYFHTHTLFMNALYDLFDIDSLKNNKNVPWNSIIIDISFMFMNVNIIVFEDVSYTLNFVTPNYININYFNDPGISNIIVLKKKETYNPVYFINTDMFFKTKLITQKIFKYNDQVTSIIKNIFSTNLNNNISILNISYIELFCKENEISLETLYINQSNLIYYVMLKYKKKNIFIPVDIINYISKNITISYDVITRKLINLNVHDLMSFIDYFNSWAVTKQSAKIEINSWLCLVGYSKEISDESDIIGFSYNNTNFYFNKIKLKDALKINNCAISQILYDPDIINAAIYNKKKSVNALDKQLPKSLYNTNIYKLILIEFLNYFHKQRNEKLRTAIKKIILKDIASDKLIDSLTDIIVIPEDMIKIKDIIFKYFSIHYDKNLLLEDININAFAFDYEALESLKKLKSHKDIYNELVTISKKLFTFGDIDKIKNFEFSNIITSCSGNKDQHCRDKKLIINKDTLYEMLDILAADIKNPVKEKWVFSNVMINNVVSYFKFIKRPNERIFAEII